MNTTTNTKTARKRALSFKTKEAAAAKLGITVVQLDLIGHAAWVTFEECSYDLPGPTISRAEAIEIALDAGRSTQYLLRCVRSGNGVKNVNDYNVAVNTLETTSYDVLIAAMKLYFRELRFESGPPEGGWQ